MKVTAKGQVTIPIEIRRQFGLTPNTEVEFEARRATIVIRKAREGRRRRANIVASLKGKATVRLTTDEILALTRR